VTVTLNKVKADPDPSHPTPEQLDEHIRRGGFITRGSALSLLRYGESGVHWIWLVDDFGKWQSTDELESRRRSYTLERLCEMIVFGDDPTGCRWRFSTVELKYT